MNDTHRSDADPAAAETSAPDGKAPDGTVAEPQDAPTDAAAEPTLEERLETALAERDELRDRLMRALAEAENIRKRAERDVRDAQAYGGTKLARDVLAVHDNLDRALSAVDDAARAAAGPVIEGVELTRRELLNAFAKHGIAPVTPAAGDRFDPKIHQAMFEAPVPGAPAGSVIQVMQPGFTIAGRLLRPALVGVAAATAADSSPAEGDDAA